MTKRLLAAAAVVAGCGFFVVTGQIMPGRQTVARDSPSAGLMPFAQQNAMVQTYCAVCHTDASMNGGFSLEHFDAAHADPGEVAMMVGKLKAQALGASGQPLPDRATQDAFQAALSAETIGANRWTVTRSQVPTTKALLTASVVREAPSAKAGGDPDLYRLKLTCQVDTHQGEMQLAWSPGVAQQGMIMSVVADGKAPATYRIEGLEKYGNGMNGTSGPGAVLLDRMLPLPAKTLAVSNLFGDGSVVFSFSDLPAAVRQEFSACSGGANGGG